MISTGSLRPPSGRWLRLDRAHPLARGLVMASRQPGLGPDLVTGQYPTLTGGDYGTSRVGPTRRSTASANDTVWPSWPSGLEPTSGGTALLLHAKTDATLRESCLFSLGGNGGVQSNRFSVHCPWTDGTVYFDFGDGRLVADTTATGGWGTPNLMRAWAYSAGARGMSIWRDGARLASSATAVSRPATGGQRYLSAAPFGYGSDLTDVALMLVWNRQLSDEELRTVTLDPWQVFAPLRLFVARTGGGGGGAVFDESVADFFAALDAASATASFAVSATEAAGVGDTGAVTASFGSSIAEAVAVLDAAFSGNIYAVSVADAVVAADGLAVAMIAAASVADVAAVSDAVAAQLVGWASIADAMTALDAVVAAGGAASVWVVRDPATGLWTLRPAASSAWVIN